MSRKLHKFIVLHHAMQKYENMIKYLSTSSTFESIIDRKENRAQYKNRSPQCN